MAVGAGLQRGSALVSHRAAGRAVPHADAGGVGGHLLGPGHAGGAQALQPASAAADHRGVLRHVAGVPALHDAEAAAVHGHRGLRHQLHVDPGAVLAGGGAAFLRRGADAGVSRSSHVLRGGAQRDGGGRCRFLGPGAGEPAHTRRRCGAEVHGPAASSSHLGAADTGGGHRRDGSGAPFRAHSRHDQADGTGRSRQPGESHAGLHRAVLQAGEPQAGEGVRPVVPGHPAVERGAALTLDEH